MESRQIELAGLQLAVAEAGSGQAKRLLLLHGFTGAKEDLTDWLDPLATAGWHAVAFDQRGHGASAHPKGEAHYSLQILTQDVTAVVDHLGWDRFVLFGHSMGGMVAQLYAIGSPQRLAGLILMGTSHGRPDGIEPALLSLGREVVRAGGTAALLQAQKDLGRGPLDTEAHRRLVARRPQYAGYGQRNILACSDDMWLAMSAEMMSQPDRLAALESLAVPTLVVVGALDEMFLPQCRSLAATISGSHLEVIPQAGHSPQLEQPDDWWPVVSGFLAGL